VFSSDRRCESDPGDDIVAEHLGTLGLVPGCPGQTLEEKNGNTEPVDQKTKRENDENEEMKKKD
jgi:hypothetical protein